jgi:hypothetical protein
MVLLFALLHSGCANLDPRVARESVRQSIVDKTGQTFIADKQTPHQRATSIEVPTADEAVRLALDDNPAIDALLAELDASEAQPYRPVC